MAVVEINGKLMFERGTHGTLRTLGPGPWCGTAGGYNNHKCRCAGCTSAWRIAYFKRQAERGRLEPPAGSHGKEATYTNWMCRCDQCRDAHAVASRDRRARRKLLVA